MTTPLCSIARENGGIVPLDCLFACPRDCRSRVYTGVGSRQTPQAICDAIFTPLAANLSTFGYTLRSGAAEGADTAFEQGAEGPEVYLPWRIFNNRRGPAFRVLHDYPERIQTAAAEIARLAHPAWHRLTAGARSLHTRNVFQVLGGDLDSPSRFVLCWTPDGAESEWETTFDTGGTRTAIVIASRNGIPVFNFAKPDAMDRFRATWVERRWA